MMEFGSSVPGFSVCNHWSPCCRRRGGHAPFEPPNLYFRGSRVKEMAFFHTCDRFVCLSHSNESVTRVKNSHVFVTHVNNSNEFFTGMTNTCEFFTHLKLDICEKLVPIKISKLVVRIFHTYQNVTYSCEYFTACQKYEV